jgi:hypothetical protein
MQVILFPRWPTQAESTTKTDGKGLKPVAPEQLHPFQP